MDKFKTEISSKHKVKTKFSKFENLISKETLLGIQKLGISEMTKIQQLSLEIIMSGDDVHGISPTGSGKTLAFAIPAIEKIKNDIPGVNCIVLSPTRELAIQTERVFSSLIQFHNHLKTGLCIGGTNIEKERQQMKDVKILIATPGRLLDHLKHCKHLKISHLKFIVFDEADRLLDEGFEKELREIIRRIKRNPVQTVLFSATVAPKVTKIAIEAMKSSYKSVTVNQSVDTDSNSDLTETYLVYPVFLKLLILHKILTCNREKKVMVFVNSCAEVTFYREIFLSFGLKVDGIQSKLSQSQRTERFKSFSENCVALFCTNIAARGWDIPAVDYVIHFDPPSSVQEYIHRIGRGCRRSGEKSTSILFLRDEETEFLQEIKETGRNLEEFSEIDMYSLDYQFETKLMTQVKTNRNLTVSATRAYNSFLTSYVALPEKSFNNETFLTDQLCKVFGLEVPPPYQFGSRVSGLKKKQQPTDNKKKIKRLKKKSNKQKL